MSSDTNLDSVSTPPENPWTAGNTTVLTESGGLEGQGDIAGETVNMVWINPGGGDTKIVSDYTFPN